MRMRVCSTPGCPNIYPREQGSQCSKHRKQSDHNRGDRGYSTKGHKTFRTAVLQRDPICVLCRVKFSIVADHWPRARKELIELGMNPNDPRYGRGLCKECHDRETAAAQPGGWNLRET